MLSNPLRSTKESELERPHGYSAPTLPALLVLCFFFAGNVLYAQVTISGTAPGSFQCSEGAAPSNTSPNDILWCDTSHWFTMNNNGATSTSPPGLAITSVAGTVDTKLDNTIFSSQVDGTFGFPSFLSMPSAGAVQINASATAPLILYIAGRKEIITGLLTTGSILSANTLYYIYLNFSTIPICAGKLQLSTGSPRSYC